MSIEIKCDRCGARHNLGDPHVMSVKVVSVVAALDNSDPKLKWGDVRGAHFCSVCLSALKQVFDAFMVMTSGPPGDELKSVKDTVVRLTKLMDVMHPPENREGKYCVCGADFGARHARTCPVWQVDAQKA